MSFRELRNLTEMMRALGYPRPISMENFRTPNFELVSDLLYWMVKKYDPSSSVTEDIDTEDDRVKFLTQITLEVFSKARIKLNPKKLYAADGFAVKEIIKLAKVLYEASRIDVSTMQTEEEEDEVSVKSLLSSRMKDPKATRQLSSDITQIGAKLYDLLENEIEIREIRANANRFLENISNNAENSLEQKYLERSIKQLLETTQENVDTTERQCIELEAEEKAILTKIKKAQQDLERNEKRLKSLQNVRPAFMDEYEKLEKELERQYSIYCEKFRNLDFLQRELDLHHTRELKKLAENDRSLKKMQKKFRDDELAILRGEQEDPLEGSFLHENKDNNNHLHHHTTKKKNLITPTSSTTTTTTTTTTTSLINKSTGKPNNNKKIHQNDNTKKGGNKTTSRTNNISSSTSSNKPTSVTKKTTRQVTTNDADDSSAESEDATSEEERGGRGNGTDSDEVSLADSGELIDNDEEEEEEEEEDEDEEEEEDDEEEGDDDEEEDEDGSAASKSSAQSGSETNSDSEDF